jgi:hypothetical protein
VVRLVRDDTNFGDRAPATEALIDIRVGGGIEQHDLEALSAELAADFPVEQPLIQWVGKVEFKSDTAVTTPAKTVADCFRYRRHVGLEVALAALRDYLRKRRSGVDALFAAAKADRVFPLMRPYVEALA